MLKALALTTTILFGLASLASSQIEYDSVRVKVAPGVTCPSGWTASTETITIPTVYRVVVPASIGGRSFRVTARFADLIWPSAANKAAAVAAGSLSIEAGSNIQRHYCSLLP